MILDLARDTVPAELNCDICVVGAGPAGISLSLELARLRPDWQVVLLEAGGTQAADDRNLAIYNARQGANPYRVLPISRRRQLGGTTAHWGGWSKPLDDVDYEDNPAWDLPAWPFGPEAFANGALARASQWCEIPNADRRVKQVRQSHSDHLLPLRADGPLSEQLFVFSRPTRFGTRYSDELAAQENLHCLLHANLYDLEWQDQRLRVARARALDGPSVRVTAQQFVLATGGLESTRILLNMRDSAPGTDEGIHSPLLGRYFADHCGMSLGTLLAPSELHYHQFNDESGMVMPVITFADSLLRKGKEHNHCLTMAAVRPGDSLLAQYRGRGALGLQPSNYWHYRTQLMIEPRPHSESRITLTDERCELGWRRMKVDWRKHDDDFSSGIRLYETLGEELARTGLGRYRPVTESLQAFQGRANGASHHMGSVRMAADSHYGVVDPDLKVFDTENLYVASTSVFPRYGYSNPTLMLVALAMRLARHLTGKEVKPT